MQFSAAPAPKALHKTDAFVLFRGPDVKRVNFLDKSLACDDIGVKVLEGPNTLEEYDQDAG